MRLLAICVAAAASGFIALSYEILWFRVYGFSTEGPPDAFGLLLASYLAGLAAGAFIAGRYCRRAAPGDPLQLRIAGTVFASAGTLAYLVIPVAARLVSPGGLGPGWIGIEPKSTLPLYALAAAGLGVVLPLLSHFAIPADERAGTRLSYVYVSNIVGSTLGGLGTGLWLLDAMPMMAINAALAAAAIVLGASLAIAGAPSPRARLRLGVTGLVAALAIGALSPILHDGLWERLLYKEDYEPGYRFARTVEGRSGVVNLTQSGSVYGGGSYDGQTNTSPQPELDDNRVLRAYLVAAFHPRPRHVLMIGLGAGAWLQVLANYDEVGRITVVEIDPAYVEIMRESAGLRSALENPKVEIVIDDGRRYLNRTDQQFDVIIQNTIVYWRAFAANLLSREYQELSRRRLAAGGVLYYNATYSPAAQKTGATTYSHALRYQNMILVSESPIEIDRERFDAALDRWTIDGTRVLPVGVTAASLDLLREQPWREVSTWEGRDSILRRTSEEPVITDDNMANEWWDLATFP